MNATSHAAPGPSLPQHTLATPPVDAGDDHPVDPAAIVETGVGQSYSIRIAEDAGICTDTYCDHSTGIGPVGFRGEKAICDLCLLEGSQELGMVLALVSVVRAYGSVDGASQAERRDALAELGAFARIYERFAAKSGPARRFLSKLSVDPVDP